jgi:hypothetical protein
MTLLSEEFTNYQLLEETDIREEVWTSALIVHNKDEESRHYRMDCVWDELSKIKNPDGTSQFRRLSKVAHIVLVIPHSNAQEERVFSMVTKNKTCFRPNLKLDGTLSSILQVKLANSEPCFKYEPESTVLKSAKSATTLYNRAHSSIHQASSSNDNSH